jgi:alanyl-tRNA synthetase
MSDSLAADDPAVRSFEATVERIEATRLVLDRTYFYAEAGGQPADRGTIADTAVVDVQHDPDADAVVHHLADPVDLAAGDTVTAHVDDAFRDYCMRAHTASHVLYGAGRRLLDDLGYGGFDIDESKVRVDFTTTTDIDDATLVELERLTNRAVWDARDVSWERVPKQEALDRENIAFNTKTEEGVLSGSDTVRVVTVDDWDVAACGGTHVSNTREIGPVEVLSRSNPGEGLTRVEFAVGPTGIDDRAETKRAALAASRELGTSVAGLPERVADLRDERDRLESDVRDLQAEVLDARLADLPAEERDGATWRVGTVAGFDANTVGDRLKSLVGEAGDVLAVVGAGDSRFVVVAATGTAETDAGDVVDRVTSEFGGGGGGGPTFAQGGGLSADADDVVAFLRE